MSVEKIKLAVGDKIVKIGYFFEEEADLKLINTRFSNHKRLKVFHHKGFKCSNPDCSNIGTRLILGLDGGGAKHWDVYTDDLILMNVDHIIPRKENGGNHIDNLQPMCFPCNTRKGAKLITNDEISHIVTKREKENRVK